MSTSDTPAKEFDIDQFIEAVKRSSRIGPGGIQAIVDVEKIETTKRGAKWGLLIPLGTECPLYVMGRVWLLLSEQIPNTHKEFFLSDVFVAENGKMTIQILGGCELRTA
jgi:hypothetical protein